MTTTSILRCAAAAIVLVVAAGCPASQAWAQQDNSAYAGVGTARDSCGHWLEVRRVPSTPMSRGELMTISWAQGYLSGKNSEFDGVPRQGNAFVIPDLSVITAFLDAQCAKDPMTGVMAHLDAMAVRLRRTQPLR
ncbi:hypothetical protein [Variovorax sp. V15]|uniref:hypothetical protein n=1 Tax=Variovorax sp. V15 TaxID=3065952 RepID=UPI0034E859FE